MKSKLYLLFMLVALIIAGTEMSIAQAPEWLWAKSIGGTGKYDNISSQSLIADPGSGDIYTFGEFDGNIDFDPGLDSFKLTSSNFFISKFDSAGNFKWAKGLDINELFEWGGVWRSDLADITVDTLGSSDVYLTGYFSDTTDFDPGEGIYRLTPVGANDIFISKLDRSGNFVWAKQLGNTGPERSYSIAIDPGGSGNIYISGEFQGTVDFDPGPGIFNLTANFTHLYLSSPFISKLDSAGNFIWAKTFVGLNAGSSGGNQKVVIDRGSGDVYTTGFFEGTLDFNPGPDTFSLTWYSYGQYGIFISKLDSSGNFVWAKLLENPLGNFVIDPLGSGNIYGLSSNGVSTKLDDFGNLVWTKKIIGTADAYTCRSFAIDPADGALYTSGHFGGKVDFDPGEVSLTLTSTGYSDGFVSKLDSAGHLVWVKRMGGMYEDFGVSMVLDASKNIYVTGSFNSPSILFDTTTLITTSNTGLDIFIAKLNRTSFTQGRIYVKQNATGNNDGTAWQNAFTKFQDALDDADIGDQIWIAAGTYIPEGPSPDSSHFLSKKAVSIYGGFEGAESDLSQRKWQTFRTVINGDILGDDQDSTNRLDNAHNILIINNGDGETTLDGLIFSGGRGALYILNTDVKIRNCTFWDNDGNNGSGLYARYSDSDSISNTLVIKNSTFEQNRGVAGAGIFLRSENGGRTLHYEIDSCTFKNNYSSSAGTIFSIRDSISQRINIIKNSEFLNNIGNYGGGAIFSVSENLIIENCNFEGNYARLYPGCCYPSGGILTFIKPSSSANIAIRKTIFNNNDVSEFSNGVVFIDGGVNAELDNVLFHGNYGYSSILSYGNTHLSNITMVDNQGGLIGYGNSTEIQNSIFDNETANFRYSGSAEIISKGGNISSDSTMAPVLMGYNGYADLHQTNPLLDSDFVPLPGSPCIDAGNPEGAPSPYDLAGNPRIHGNGIDAGAFESLFMVAVKDAVWDSQVFSIYPNPVLDVLNFELESDWIGKIRLHVYNNQGQPVYKSEINKSDRVQTFKENLSLLPPGEYVVLAITGKTTYATKVIFLR